MFVNGNEYGKYGSTINGLRRAFLEHPHRVEDFGSDLLALTDDQDQKWLFWNTDEAWDLMLNEIGWGAQERSWKGHYAEPDLEEVDQDQYDRDNIYWDWWRTVVEPHWDRVDPNDLEIACVDQWRPVWTIDGIVRDEDGDEQYHKTCWNTWGVQLRPEAQFWTFDNWMIQEEIVELAENGYICYRIFDLLPEED
jgi:hypothetical protein